MRNNTEELRNTMPRRSMRGILARSIDHANAKSRRNRRASEGRSQVMRSLATHNHRISHDLLVVRINAIEYAALLRIPLTTFRQLGRQIDEIAMAAVLE